MTETQIRDVLKSAGWDDVSIHGAYTIVNTELHVPKPPPSNDTPLENEERSDVKHALTDQKQQISHQDISVNSPYSIIISVGLLLSLLILGNQLFRDMSDIKNIATKLIVEAIVITPVLLIIFLLNNSFQDRKKRFQILIQPYYMVAIWMFLRLFVQLLFYLYDKAAAFGIYVALGLIVALLTGVIIFAQKKYHEYKHN